MIVFVIFTSWFFETALVIALLHRLVYCFVISLRLERIASMNSLSKPAEVANFVVAIVSKRVKNYLARPNDTWNSRG